MRRRYVTRLDRFQEGDYPLVCAVSGVTDGVELVSVTVRRVSIWPWMFLFVQPLIYLFAGGPGRKVVVGWLPLAENSLAKSLDGYYEPGAGVILRNVHDSFVAACKEAQLSLIHI